MYTNNLNQHQDSPAIAPLEATITISQYDTGLSVKCKFSSPNVKEMIDQLYDKGRLSYREALFVGVAELARAAVSAATSEAIEYKARMESQHQNHHTGGEQ